MNLAQPHRTNHESHCDDKHVPEWVKWSSGSRFMFGEVIFPLSNRYEKISTVKYKQNINKNKGKIESRAATQDKP